MKIPTTTLAQLCALAVLAAPLALLGATQEESNIREELNLTKYVEPVFPDMVRYEGVVEGAVALAVSQGAAGEPQDILVLSATHRRLGEAAVAAVRQWRFAPTEAAGVSAARMVRLSFRLQGVVILPYGKNHQSELTAEQASAQRRSEVKVPQLQALARQPKALAQPMPAYPAALVPRGSEGTASVRFYVDETGRVRLPEVLAASAPEFGAAALAAVAQWRYEPPQHGGRTVVAADNWAFKFTAVN
ncbi:MAG: TonB family protein [Lacunisphaera sp.]|jgi:TonB family protein|nr:TonB family protein [Lacunisphaera sp.]